MSSQIVCAILLFTSASVSASKLNETQIRLELKYHQAKANLIATAQALRTKDSRMIIDNQTPYFYVP